MKLFFIIFGAILAAAAVIWGVHSHDVAEQERAATTLGLLKSEKELSELSREQVIWRQDVSNLQFDLSQAKSIAVQLSLIKKFKTRVSRFEVRSIVEDIVSNYQEEVRIVREKYPEQRKWADDMDETLTEIRAATGMNR